MTIRQAALAAFAVAGLALAGCSREPEDKAPVATTSAGQTVAQALDDADDLQTIAEALKVTGLKSLFARKGSYTLLAPGDDAFASLGEKARRLTDTDDYAPLAALLRDHIIRGRVTPRRLSAAIDASPDHAVQLQSLGGTVLTFTKWNDRISVSSSTGIQAAISGEAIEGDDDVAIPIDAVLAKV